MSNPCGQTIKQRRQELGWSIRTAADAAGISEGRLRQIENGFTTVAAGVRTPTHPSQRILRTLARALDLDADELIAMAESGGRSTEPDAKDAAHQAFVELIQADPTLDDISKNHIINQHAILQRVAPPEEELTAADLDRIAAKKAAGIKAVKKATAKKATRNRQTPESR